MKCGHPLAARAIRQSLFVGSLETRCWACVDEAEASRARAKGYNVRDEYSVPIAHTVQRPSARLYSESEGVDVPEYRRNG